MDMKELRFLCPNGHLGFAPLKAESFYLGVEAKPDLIVADSGSCDQGPGPLALDTSISPLEWQKHDLEHMLLAARRLGVPMIVSSAGDTGTNSRVDRFVSIIKELAAKHNLPKFKLGYFYSEVSKEELRERLGRGEVIKALESVRLDLSVEDVEATDRIVAMADIHPFVELLDMGADVIIGGRSSDVAPFAAPAIRAGVPKALAYFMGKIVECSSFCAEPFAGKESVMGMVSAEGVRVTPMLPSQRCTISSVAGHTMYERSNPFYEHVASGVLDMSEAQYEQCDERTVRATGTRFLPAEQFSVKLEGAGKVGERYIGIASIRDPHTIANVDRVIGWAKEQVRLKFGDTGYELHYHVYGRNGVMGDLEPVKESRSHELGVVVQGVAPTKEMAEEVCMTGTRQMFYARMPEVMGSAGAVAFVLDEVLPASPACTWTINHTMAVDDPMQLFPVYVTEVAQPAEARA